MVMITYLCHSCGTKFDINKRTMKCNICGSANILKVRQQEDDLTDTRYISSVKEPVRKSRVKHDDTGGIEE